MGWIKRLRSTIGAGRGPTRDRATHSPAADTALEARTRAIGEELLERAGRARGGLLSAGVFSDRLMQWSMRDEGFKTQLFRFVDVFPALRTPEAVMGHLREYLSQPGVTLPTGMGLALGAGDAFGGAAAKTITSQVQSMAGRFIAGTDAADALPTLRKRWDAGVAFSVDLLGEACVSDAEAEVYRRRYLDLIADLPAAVSQWPGNDRLERDHLGPIPRCNVSVKLSSLFARADAIAFDRTVDALVEAMSPILHAATRTPAGSSEPSFGGVFVNFDIEQHAMKELTLATFERCCERFDFPAGLAMQAYLRSGDADAKRIADWSKRIGRRVTVRLVKGAYWDYETIHAELMGWPTPVWSRKVETDACFERMTATLLDATPRDAGDGGVSLAVGSHNARSIAAALAMVEQRGLPQQAIELQMLHGMADPLKRAAVEMGLRLREYVPVGALIPGMAYLVRRLLENTSNESWLRAGFAEDAPPHVLLAPPAYEATRVRRDSTDAPGADAWSNEPMRDFADAARRNAFGEALRRLAIPRVEEVDTAAAERAVGVAVEALPRWRGTDPDARAGMLMRAAGLMRRRRDELAGVIVRESGKPWREADADVCEAIDFCTFYATHGPTLFRPARLSDHVGELNEQWHEPRGVAAVIAPWNFPQAIVTGMTAAALVTGNPTIVKPAEQTPGIARLMVEMMWEAGIPHDVLQFTPGRGEAVGAALVRDQRVALIAFTGSKGVGLRILEEAGRTPHGQGHVKKVVCEMGGKNAIIVDGSADLDEAVVGVRQSAFGYAGQKCSACSRVIVVDGCYDAFVPRLIEATRTLVVGDPLDPATDVGPVIDDAAAEKVRRYVEIGKSEGELALAIDPGVERVAGKPLIGPHVFTGIRQSHRLANEEVFGPVLAVMRARDFDEALAMANGTDFKLTGGVFSRTPSHLDQARREFRVGNLYLNRGITGALVGRHPFGGFGLSGGGTKAGGREYLLHFTVPRACSENTMRRGFAPES
jgi:RHH-type proline utilization regulon transcriptional repressor/proline dehydrogenase/delta 1-pyrroline-5-carboxylate dehydrogenase